VNEEAIARIGLQSQRKENNNNNNDNTGMEWWKT
jgi:hypothetical protein